MKKTLYYIFILASSLAALNACQMEIQGTGSPDANAVHMTFTAQIEGEQTKTVMDGDVASVTRYVTWQKGDEVWVCNGASSAKFTNSLEDGAQTALLEGELAPGSDYYAFYPYSMVEGEAIQNDRFSITLPATQQYYEGGFAPESYPMAAVASEAAFSFKNLCGILVIQLRGSAAITSISFCANQKPVSGAAYVDVSHPETLAFDGTGAESNMVTLQCASPVQLDAATPTSFHIVLPPGEYSQFTILANASDGTSMAISSQNVLEIVRSRRTTAAALDYVGSTTIDLSESGTANSYIVSASGNYKFKMVKGNSTESVGAVASVETLWESNGTSTAPQPGSLITSIVKLDEYVLFSASESKGNAVIAAKDADGTILWSWHIWLADQPEDQQYFNDAGVMMDRNLGALTADVNSPLSYGLLYQWGRKDPFPCGDVKSTNTGWGETYSSSATMDAESVISRAIQEPLTILMEGEGYAERSSDLWGHEKTKYDPCPEGYRVPDGGANGIWANATSSEPFDYRSVNDLFGVDDLYGVGCHYPSSPLRYWSCTHEDGAGRCSYIMLWREGDTVYPTTNDYPQRALGVRCQKATNSETVPVTEIHVLPSYKQLDEGQTYQLSAQVLPADANNKMVRWSSDNSEVAEVSLSGLVTGVSSGTCKITATASNGKSASCTVTVNDAAIDLTTSGTANCYVISQEGRYKIKTVKGNTDESVGTVASAEVLWESYGTDTAPSVGDLVSGASYADGYITFTASDKKGNAVIAAKDVSGTILWSWHIWMTDKPVDQVYNNGAGTMMDRNLGATSATPGDVHALGLLYQWGRKDPFMSGSSISSSTEAASTSIWPSDVSSDASNGTMAYTVSHPTTFITYNTINYDWYYTGSSSTDNTRWQTSGNTKGLYDPCPVGYRVPDGGATGVWARAFGTSIPWTTSSNWDSTNNGMNFGATDKNLVSASTIWYPFAGYLKISGGLLQVGSGGRCWSCSPSGNYACSLVFYYDGNITPSHNNYRADGLSVRCIQEGSSTPVVNVSGVSLNKTSLSLPEGESSTLIATVNPSNATMKDVTWKSSSTSVATVDQTGKVTAVKAGSATITVSSVDGSKTATCSVTVESASSLATDLSASGTANSYIVSSAGTYKIKTVKGNSAESVGTVASAEVLWESYGTSTAPSVGDLVSGASYADGYITFTASSKKGNAVIAAKDASGTILWSWHIWMTDQPVDQVYNNGAGTMMDRNLGATSATPGDVHALGLLYQWGRKDPFLGSSSISSSTKAASTGTWPSAVSSDAGTGTIAYAIAHPTQFLTYNGHNSDWLYTGSSSTDFTRWQTSDNNKGLYDPCPNGYRVPDGGGNGVWSTAFGVSNRWTTSTNWDSINMGMDFSITDNTLGSVSVIWYPSAGNLTYYDGSHGSVGSYGDYWSCTHNNNEVYGLNFIGNGSVIPSSYSSFKTAGKAVRCLKEGSTQLGVIETDLSSEGTANSYIVSDEGKYKIKTVKGNSAESVGTVASAEVLWESYGTNTAPSVGDLIRGASYANGYITFTASDKKGNAVIAAKDASGTILWSWHIWMTDKPVDQVYNNNAGTMMDRNLGATSATPGDAKALGLLYQWGRKDPFLGGCQINYSSSSEQTKAASTCTWPSAVSSDASKGTIEYAVYHPTTFITSNTSNGDWYYTGSSSTDDTRWQTNGNTKGLYDPCPVGYRVPDGGSSGVWSKAFGTSIDWTTSSNWDSTNNGMNFAVTDKKLGSASTIWYPSAGYLNGIGGSLVCVGSLGYYWSCSPTGNLAYSMYFIDNGNVSLLNDSSQAFGGSVRCLQE